MFTRPRPSCSWWTSWSFWPRSSTRWWSGCWERPSWIDLDLCCRGPRRTLLRSVQPWKPRIAQGRKWPGGWWAEQRCQNRQREKAISGDSRNAWSKGSWSRNCRFCHYFLYLSPFLILPVKNKAASLILSLMLPIKHSLKV